MDANSDSEDDLPPAMDHKSSRFLPLKNSIIAQAHQQLNAKQMSVEPQKMTRSHNTDTNLHNKEKKLEGIYSSKKSGQPDSQNNSSKKSTQPSENTSNMKQHSGGRSGPNVYPQFGGLFAPSAITPTPPSNPAINNYSVATTAAYLQNFVKAE